jgi:hypothetical protein
MKIKSLSLFFFAVILTFLFFNIAVAKDDTKTEDQKYTISTKQIMDDVAGPPENYPKYTTQLINLANQNSQATRAHYVGQMSELIQEFPGNSYDQWVQWYMGKYPNAVDQATDRTWAMIQKMQQAMEGIDKDMVRQWMQELIFTKTYAGLCFQESILKTIAKKKKQLIAWHGQMKNQRELTDSLARNRFPSNLFLISPKNPYRKPLM